MKFGYAFSLAFIPALLFAAVSVRVAASDATQSTQLLTNIWAVRVSGDAGTAKALAAKYGFVNNGQVGNLKDVYEFILPKTEYTRAGRSITAPYRQVTNTLNREPSVVFAEQQVMRRMEKKGYREPTDPDWPKQWFLLNSNTGVLQQNGDSTRDLNVEPAWIQGVTGCNVVVAVIDDGVDFTHPDLSRNYVEELDYNAITDGDTALPEYSNETHGTSCAGIIAMEKSNNVCAVGVAYESQLIGIRLVIPEGQTDINDAKALSYKNNVIDIYSNSWGPPDGGYFVDGPGPLAKLALETSSKTGREGKGSIYVWAAGNGGQSPVKDSCAADGYVQSIYTIAIGSLSSAGTPAYYDERCSAKLASAFVNNYFFSSIHVATTTTDGECVEDFDGTSAATPVGSGTIALALEVNPDLTWRDVQYLIVYTSNPDILTVDDLTTNGAGLKFSHSFGFGAIDAEAMVTRARHWTNVPEQKISTINPSITTTVVQPSSSETIVVPYLGDQIGYLEHVVVLVSTSFEGVDVTSYLDNDVYYYLYYDFSHYENNVAPNRGDIQIELTSPQGTRSILLPQRPRDSWPGEYNRWPFMSVHFWGEDPSGNWMLKFTNSGSSGVLDVSDISVTLYGTAARPEVIGRIPPQCDAACVRGCAAAGAEFCDSCRNLRDAVTLQCVDQCNEGQTMRSGYCYSSTELEPKCEKKNLTMEATEATTTPGTNTTSSASGPSGMLSLLILTIAPLIVK